VISRPLGASDNYPKTRRGSDEVETWATGNFPPAAEMDAFVKNVPTAVLQLMSVRVLHSTERSTEDDPERALT
jgi:hypothetical protein